MSSPARAKVLVNIYNNNNTLPYRKKTGPSKTKIENSTNLRERIHEVMPATGCEWGKKILEQNMRMERSYKKKPKKKKKRIDKQHGNRVANARRRP